MNLRNFIWYWGPPLVLMTIIFILSSQQRISVSESYSVNVLVFKSLHLIEYAALYFLLFRAYYNTLPRNNMKNIYIAAIVTAILYAISDELHQTFVPTRNGSIIDVFIDTTGILLCFQYTRLYLRKLKPLL